MKQQHKFLVWLGLLFFALLAIPTHTSQAADNTFKVGMEAGYPPFNWTQTDSSNGAVQIQGSSSYAGGYDVQMAKKVAKSLGKKLVVVKTSWDGLAPALTSGKIDAIIAGMSPTPERRKTIDFSDTYYKSQLVIIVRKNGKYADATKLSDFKNAKLTGQLNTYHYTALNQIKGVIKEPAMKDFPSMRVALESGTIDGYVSEKPEGISVTRANPNVKMLEFSGTAGFHTNPADTDLAIGLRKNDPDKERINAALAKISAHERDQIMTTAVEQQPQSKSSGNWVIALLKQYGGMLASGTGITLLISMVGTIVGFIIGLLVGILRTIPRTGSKARRGLLRVMDWLLSVYIEVFRGTPMIVQAAVVYYGAAQAFGWNMNRLAAALVIVSVNTGAYLAEIMRGGIIAVDAGQFEAAHALGMTHLQTMNKIILPQAIRNSLPAVTNEFVINIKDTSVLSVISVSELFFQGSTIAGQNFQFFHTYLIISAIYLILTFTITRILRAIERHMAGPQNYNLMANQDQVSVPKVNSEVE
ncbi:ABC transporter permease subunit [Lapidilactobacillus gannanensis]|uniref:ABC transporter permease subunit n=1 Tax=Lapidilactobacillus gannanensis TaxID=2486002 RepID=A0ABW4BJS2_9LACO|nr:ABC transporter permease subunit [Lapidilactobacillus gannanensis]